MLLRCPQCRRRVRTREGLPFQHENSLTCPGCEAKLSIGVSGRAGVVLSLVGVAGIAAFISGMFVLQGPSADRLVRWGMVGTVLPIIVRMFHITVTRYGRGRCPHCGYDNTNLPPGSPCPECGASPEPNRPRDP